MLPESDPKWQLTDKGRNLALRCRRVSAARHEDRDAISPDSGGNAPIEDHREDTGQARPPGRIGNHDHRVPALRGEVSEGLAVDGIVDGPRQQSTEIARFLGGERLKRTHLESSQIEGDVIRAVREPDNHRITIPSSHGF